MASAHLNDIVEGDRIGATDAGAMATLEILALATQAYHERRQRDRYFGQSTFAEPTWDVLLDLFIRQIEGRSTTVSSACIAASVPTTTALRCIESLHQANLVRRVRNPADSRSRLLELTPAAIDMMVRYLRDVHAKRSVRPRAGRRFQLREI